ncbi:hypothetical protein IPJ72_01850 [Candidatus Peregrinibacteria bacterium]|nr:MAG: hypothetical protein IPJ72_01850 [Candidatus Peregrinibacteria bacterium]
MKDGARGWYDLIIRLDAITMIYLIGGSPRSGKTTLAKKLSSKLNSSLISTDNLRLFLMNCLSNEEKYHHFPFEKMFDEAGTVEKFYKITSGENMLKADLKEAEYIMPGIKALIHQSLKDEVNLIFEGIHLVPNFLKELSANSNTRIVMLTKSNEQKIAQGLERNRGNNDWIADNINDKETLTKVANSLAEYGEYFRKEAGKNKLIHINTEENFSEKIEHAMNMLLS